VCTATYKVTAADIKAGYVNNLSAALGANFSRQSVDSNEVVTPIKDAVLTGELADTGDDLSTAYIIGAGLVLAGALVLRRSRKLQ
jgi:LPXTG-motif cell wall-anchored protein